MYIASRIMVYGATGSGKTTLAEKIGAATGLPFHAIDDLTWLPNWQEVPLERQREIIFALVAQDAWVIDAGYGKWLDLVLPKVELIVCLDYAPPLIFARLLWRTVRRVVLGELGCNGNREGLRMQLGKDSILRWFFKSYRRKRTQMRAWEFERPCKVTRFTHPRHAESWLRSELNSVSRVD